MRELELLLSKAAAISLVILIVGVSGFNVDVDSAIRHRGPPGSWFGFSVAEHRERGQNWVIVGAPSSDSPRSSSSRPGAVFRCAADREVECQEIFETTVSEPKKDSQGYQLDNKTGQWFGATVRSSGEEDGLIVACAPRYVWFSTKHDQRNPVGTCYVASNSFQNYLEFSPCRTRNWGHGHHRQGSCQAGLGADLSKDGKRLFIGAAGSWYWQGQMFSLDSKMRYDYLPLGAPENKTGQVFSQSTLLRTDVRQTWEGPAVDDDSYLGYSVASGDLQSDGEGGVAVGMPRGHGLKGKVLLYTWDLVNYKNVTGEQMGAYFGYSLAVNDIDGDGTDDLIVGAPLHTVPNNDNHYETGRVYVFLQGQTKPTFTMSVIKDGKTNKGRFGLSLCSLGDINLDGFGDFAVGAPYDGNNGRGAIHIFMGTHNGVRKTHQTIYAEDVAPYMSTFGFSLAGGTDLDGNTYPDMVVGAYESASSVVLRARPVVDLKVTLSFEMKGKMINLERRDCKLRSGQEVSCVPVKACFNYTGLGVRDALDFEVQILLDTKNPPSPRMFFLEWENRNSHNMTVSLRKGQSYCKTFQVYIQPRIRDKLNSLDVLMKYTLPRVRMTRSLFPVLDMHDLPHQQDFINIEKNCGGDQVCIPDLSLRVMPSVDHFLLGAKNPLWLDVLVRNEGEDSFESTFELRLPQGITFGKIERKDEQEYNIPIQCSAPSVYNNNTLKCDIGNPLPTGKHVKFQVRLHPSQQKSMDSEFRLLMEVNSTNPENSLTYKDNRKVIKIPIWVQTELEIKGSSFPPDMYYNQTQYRVTQVYNEKKAKMQQEQLEEEAARKDAGVSLEAEAEEMHKILTVEDIKKADLNESEIGPQVVHIYTIKNQGPADIRQAEVVFLWPAETLSGDPLLYLLEQPETSGPILCQQMEEVNALGVRLERKGNYLDSDAIALSGSGVTIEEKWTNIGAGAAAGGASGSSSENSTSYHSRTGSGHSTSSSSSSSSSQSNRTSWVAADGKRWHDEESSHENRGLYAAGGRGSGSGGATADGERRTHQSGSTYHHESSGGRGETHRGVGEGSITGEESYSRTHSGGGRVSGGHAGVSRTGESGTRRDEIGSSVVGNEDRVWSSGDTRTHGGRTSWSHSEGSEVNKEENHRAGGGRGMSEQDREEGYTRTQIGGGRQSAGRGGGSRTHQQGGESERRQGGSGDESWRTETRTQDGKTSWSQSGEGGAGVEGGIVVHSGGRTYITDEERYNRGGHRESSGTHISSGTGEHQETSGTHISSGSGGHRESSGTHISSGSGGHRESSGTHASSSSGGFSGGDLITGVTEEIATFNWTGPTDGKARTFVFGVAGKDSPEYDYSGSKEYEEASSRETGNRGASGGISRQYGTGSGHSEESSRRDSSRHQSGGNRGVDGAGSVHWETSHTSEQNRGEPSGGSRGYERHHSSNSESSSSNSSHSSEPGVVTHWSTSGDGYHESGGRGKSGYEESRNSESSHSRHASTQGGGGSRTSGRRTWNTEPGFENNNRHGSGSYEKAWGTSFSTEKPLQGGKWKYSNWTKHEESSFEDRSPDGTSKNNDLDLDDDGRLKLYQRYRRSVQDKEALETVTCENIRCLRMQCTVGPLTQHADEASVAFRGRIWVPTYSQLSISSPILVSSRVVARISELPYIGSPSYDTLRQVEVITQVNPAETPPRPDIVPLWVVVLSACAGTLILLLLIFLLWKCGFFNRNRPSDTPEKEPLNRNNGHYNSGDEAL